MNSKPPSLRMIAIHLVVVAVLLLQSILPSPVQAAASQAGRAATGAALGTAIIRAIPASSLVEAGQVFQVSVDLSSLADPLSGFQFDLVYNPAVIAFQGALPGSFLASSGRSQICPPGAASPGSVRFACASAGPGPGPSGPGLLATLTFRALAPGSSQLDLSNVKLAGQGIPAGSITPAVQPGAVTVAGSASNLRRVYMPFLSRSSAAQFASGSAPQAATPDDLATQPVRETASTLSATAGLTPEACYATDLDCDGDIDEADVQHAAQSWNCASGSTCYAAKADLDGSGLVDVFDLAWVGNDYDTSPPILHLTSPLPGAVLSPGSLLVRGEVSDSHPVASVSVNGLEASVSSGAFSISLNLTSGSQVLRVQAADAVGQTNVLEQVNYVDGEGPRLVIKSPRSRQSVYSLTPTIEIAFSDYIGAVNTASFTALLADANGQERNIRNDLAVTETGALGVLSQPLTPNQTYTLTATLRDTAGNLGQASSRFYVPADPASLVPPAPGDHPGWINGLVYDSSSCDPYLTTCRGLAGAMVTAQLIDPAGLAAARLARLEAIQSDWRQPPLEPLGFASALPGTVVSGPDGFFSFPVPQAGLYWLRIEKAGYTFSQRQAEVVPGHAGAATPIYLTPIDPTTTPCSSTGCTHTNSSDSIELVVPAGAIAPGTTVNVNATSFEHVEFLPSGELPPGTWETYAFDLGGAEHYVFSQPVSVRLANTRGFAPGTEIPLGYWNDITQQWEHAGMSVVDPTGQWLETQVTHFSPFDMNVPVSPLPNVGAQADGGPPPEDGSCGSGSEACFVDFQSGRLNEKITPPAVQVLDANFTQPLNYNTRRADPSIVLDFNLKLNPSQGVSLSPWIGFDLYIDGFRTEHFTISTTLQSGEVGRFRYLWDGRDANGELLPPGSYSYAAAFHIPYRAEYCLPIGHVFGNPPDCQNFPTGVFVDAYEEVWQRGVALLDTQAGGPYGAGWVPADVQRLYQDQSGHILVTDGSHMVSFYASGQDQLSQVNSALANLPAVAALKFIQTATAPDESLNASQPDLADASQLAGENPVQLDLPAPASAALDSSAPLLDMPTTDVGGTIITHTTWTLANSPYFVVSPVLVPDNIQLTIEPGVTVFFNQNMRLDVQGILQAVGSAAQPIQLLPSLAGASGYWRGLSIGGGSIQNDSSLSHLSYVTIEGAGQQIASLYVESCAPQMDHITIRRSGFMGFALYNPPADMSFPSFTVEDSVLDGVYLSQNAPVAAITFSDLISQNNGQHGLFLGGASNTIHINGGSLNNNAGYGIYTVLDNPGSSLSGLAIQNNAVAARLSPDTLLQNMTWSGNVRNEIEWLTGRITSNRTWGAEIGHRMVGTVTVADNVTLTISPGVTVWMGGPCCHKLNVEGILHAVGSLAQPVQFLPVQPQTGGAWFGITLGGGSIVPDSSASQLSHVILDGAGAAGTPAIFVGSVSPSLDHLTIRNSGGVGLVLSNTPDPMVIDTALIENSALSGLQINTQGSITLQNILSQDNGGSGITVSNASLLVENSTLRANRATGISMDAGSLTLRNSLITGNTSAAVLPASALMENNTWLNNISNTIVLRSAIITAPRTFSIQDGGVDTYRVFGSISVASGITLTIQAGVTLEMEPNTSLDVDGILTAVGTYQQPIRFTSVLAGATGTWNQVRIGNNTPGSPSDRSRLSHVLLEGGGKSLASLYLLNCVPDVLDNLTITRSGLDGVYVNHATAAALTIRDSNFIQIGRYAINNLSSPGPMVVDARQNYWGDPSGPFHPSLNPDGLGAAVTDRVTFSPWYQNPVLDSGVVNLSPADHTTLTFDPADQTYTRHYPDGKLVHFNPDGTHEYTLERTGLRTSYTYLPDLSLASMSITLPGEAAPRWVWSLAYAGGMLDSITDPAGRITSFTYNSAAQLTRVDFPDGSTRQFFYDSRGLMTGQADPLGELSSYVYNNLGRVHVINEPPRPVYDPASGQVTVQPEVRTLTVQDSDYILLNDSPAGTPQNPAPAAPRSSDLLAGVTYGRGGESGHLNPRGLWLDRTDGEGNLTGYTYDDANNRLSQQNPDGSCETAEYDANGSRTRKSEIPAAECGQANPPAALTWNNTYEPRFNQVKTITDPLGRTTAYFYDYELNAGEAGDLVRIEYPPTPDEAGVVVTPTQTFTYTQFSQVAAQVSPRGVVTRYVYTQGTPDEADGGANPLFAPGVTPVPGLQTEIIEDANGLQIETIRRDFNALGLPQTLVAPNGAVSHIEYDLLGQPTRLTDALGRVTLSAYDLRGNISQVIQDYTPDGTTGRNLRTDFKYNYFTGLVQQRTSDQGRVEQITRVYDINRQLGLEIDSAGATTRYRYDTADRLTTRIDAAGSATVYTYTPDGLPETITSPDGSITRLAYDAYRRPSAKTEDFGGLNLLISYTYDLAGRMISSTDPAGVVSCSMYDAMDRLVRQTLDCSGLALSTDMAYDLDGNRVRVTDPRGVVTTYTVDALNRTTQSVRDAGSGRLNLTAAYTYDELSNLIQSVDALGVATTYEYDPLGQRTAQVVDPGSGRLNLSTTYTYDRLGYLSTITDPLGRSTVYQYNGLGDLLGQVNPLGQAQVYTYDYAGNRLQTSYPDGQIARFTYDLLRRQTSITDSLGGVVRYAYDALGRRVQETDQNGHTTIHSYDKAGRLTSTTDALNHTTTYLYDPMGRLVRQTNPLGQATSYQYDALGRQLKETLPTGESTLYTYDAAGSRTSITRAVPPAGAPADGQTTTFEYDRARRLVRVTDPLGSVIRYEYDAAGQRTRLWDGNNHATTYAYDAAGRLVQSTDPLGSLTSHAYDAAGQLTSSTDGEGQTVRYTYDAAGRQTTVEFPDNTGFARSYDSAGRLLAVEGLNTSVQFSYDVLGRMTGLSDSLLGKSLAYTYDAASNLLGINAPDGLSVAYQYDAANQLIRVTHGGQNYQMAYDAAGRMTRQDFPNGAHQDVTYDASGRIIRMENLSPSGQAATRQIYQLDAAGNRRSMTSLDGALTTYTYDKANQLVSEQRSGAAPYSQSFQYDPAGNRTRWVKDGAITTYTYNAANQLVQSSGAQSAVYTYDLRGDLHQKTEGGQTATYSYDVLGRLKTAARPGLNASYAYDAFGRLAARTENGQTTRFLYDTVEVGATALAEYSGGTLQAGYVLGPGVDNRLALVTGGQAYYYLSDGLVSTRAMMSAASGALVNSYDYDGYGNLLASQERVSNAYRFAGRRWDPAAELYDSRARYYNPGTGRFTQPDPLLDYESPNLYQYALNNPANRIDPLGWSSDTCTAHSVKLESEGLGKALEEFLHLPVLSDEMKKKFSLGATVSGQIEQKTCQKCCKSDCSGCKQLGQVTTWKGSGSGKAELKFTPPIPYLSVIQLIANVGGELYASINVSLNLSYKEDQCTGLKESTLCIEGTATLGGRVGLIGTPIFEITKIGSAKAYIYAEGSVSCNNCMDLQSDAGPSITCSGCAKIGWQVSIEVKSIYEYTREGVFYQTEGC